MKFLSVLAASFLFVNSLLAQEANTLLWKIEAPHLTRPSYLYGTMHSKDKRAHQFGDSVLAKLNACDAVALELLTGEMKENPFAMMGLMMMKDTTLDMLLSKKNYKVVKNYAEEHLALFAALVDKIKPIFTSALLTEQMMRSDEPLTVDEFFEKTGEENGKKLIGIETVEEQMNALSRIGLKEQAEMLVEQIKSGDKDNALFEQLMDYYKNQDLNGMMKIYKSEEVPELFDEALVTRRNHVMAERIDSIIRMQPTFVGVGALHLAGADGLIELLRKEKYAVTPVISSRSAGNKQ